MAEVWEDLKEVRLKLMDPQGVINLVQAANRAALPSVPRNQYGYRLTDTGEYYVNEPSLGAWEPLPLRIADDTLNALIAQYGVGGAIQRAIPPIMAKILSEMSVLQISSGTDSTQYQSLETILGFYRGLKGMYAEEAKEVTGFSTGRSFRCRRPTIGGVREW